MSWAGAGDTVWGTHVRSSAAGGSCYAPSVLRSARRTILCPLLPALLPRASAARALGARSDALVRTLAVGRAPVALALSGPL